MPFKSRFTEEDERRIWEQFVEGKLFKQVAAQEKLPTGTIYRILQKAQEKWGVPKQKNNVAITH